MHAQLDDWTRFLIALAPCISSIALVIGALNNLILRKQNKKLVVHDQKMDQLSTDVNGRVNELVDAKAAVAKLEATENMKVVVKDAVKEAVVEAKSTVPGE